MTKRTIFRIVLALAFLAYVGYSQLRTGAGEHAAPARALLPPVPASAKQITLGKLAFNSCELAQKRSGATTAAFCAPFQVPEDWDAPDAGGRKIDLNLALIKADAEAADTDFVVFLAGGPGQAAIENWPQVAPAFAPLRKHHHILLLDQRGTGGSNALSCGRVDKDEPADAPAESSANLDEVRRVTSECLAQVLKKADPRYYTTTDAAHDLEAVRQALGAPQFDLVGVSYGTRVAQQYLVRYPDGVRSDRRRVVARVGLLLHLGEAFACRLAHVVEVRARFSRRIGWLVLVRGGFAGQCVRAAGAALIQQQDVVMLA